MSSGAILVLMACPGKLPASKTAGASSPGRPPDSDGRHCTTQGPPDPCVFPNLVVALNLHSKAIELLDAIPRLGTANPGGRDRPPLDRGTPQVAATETQDNGTQTGPATLRRTAIAGSGHSFRRSPFGTYTEAVQDDSLLFRSNDSALTPSQVLGRQPEWVRACHTRPGVSALFHSKAQGSELNR